MQLQESVVFVLKLRLALCYALDPSDGPHFPVANWWEKTHRVILSLCHSDPLPVETT